jgi:5-methyltetrahydropteroyltriglutamate--homocysteine methyltransferase
LNWGRDRQLFRDFYEAYDQATGSASGAPVVCTGPIAYQGQATVQGDIDTFKAALAGVHVEEAFIPAVAPGTIELQRRNEYYPTDEAYLFAIAEAMREEYRAIVDAGFLLQIDDPRVVTQYGMPDPAPTIAEYRQFAERRVEALNHALAGIPADRVRYHLCWGSWHGPHVTDVPLQDIVDIVLRVRAGAYCVEAANPRHEHEWQVWEGVKLPDGKVLIPGVVAHTTNIVEHPELIAWRLMTYARLVGKENVIAGTDCGFSQGAFTPRLHPSIMWAKLGALAEGATLATTRLWSRPSR